MQLSTTTSASSTAFFRRVHTRALGTAMACACAMHAEPAAAQGPEEPPPSESEPPSGDAVPGQRLEPTPPATEPAGPEPTKTPEAPPKPEPPPAAEPPPTKANDPELTEIERALAEDEASSASAEARGDEPVLEAAPPPPGGSGVQSLNPNLSFILDVAGAYFSEDENLQTGAHDPVETGFNLQQLELAISSVVDPYLRFDANLVFGLFGVELEEAYGTTLALPGGLQARFGQFLTKYGRINATHPHSWDFVDQPIAIGRVFGAEGSRGLGLELSWLTPLPWYVELVGSATNADGEASARSFFGAEDPGVDDVADFQYTTALKQFFPFGDDWSLFWGMSAAFGPNPTGRNNRTEVYGTDLYVKYRPITRGSSSEVTLQTEWMHRRRQVPEDVIADVTGYVQLAWRISKHWGTAGRYEYGSPESGDGDISSFALDPEWTDDRHRITANATYWPTEFSRFRLQGSSDLPGWLDDPIYAVFLNAELVTGAHGSHAF